jgi:trehalose/maltose transport system substrate-binding protein
MRRRQGLALIGALVLAAGLAGCGGGGGTGSSSGKSGGFEGRGPIKLATGKDTTGTLAGQLSKWNSMHPNEKVDLVELPESADQQRQQFIQNAQTKSDAYTVLNMDVVWTAEFAANQWIDELPADQFPLNEMLPSVVETGKYFNRLYAVPYNTNAGLLFYRKDLLDKAGITAAPKTWDEMKAACTKVKALPEAASIGCYAGQFDKYEGLTVNFSEAVDSAGGQVVGSDGKASVNSAEAKKGLQFLVDGFGNGVIPNEAITYKEEDGRRAFQAGKLLFHRQWPYQWVLANKTDGSSQVAGKFAVAPLPGASGPGKSSLGGANLAISKYGKNKATALDFVKWFSNAENARQNLEANSLAPVYTSLYADTALQQKFPYLAALKESLANAVARPRVVHYGDATTAIQENAYAALTKKKTVDQALADMQKNLEEVIAKK